MSKQRIDRRSVLKGAGILTAATVLDRTGLAGAALASAAGEPTKGGATPQATGATATAAGASKTTRLRFGVTTAPETKWADAVQFWKEADRLGFDSAFVFDHPMEHRHEAWTMLSALATQTSRIHAGVLVSSSSYRVPAITAKMAATIDHLSGGRAILGLGAGWLEREFLGYGIPFHDKGERARRLAEGVEIAHRLFTEPVVNYEGKYYVMQGGVLEPKPIQKPLPILVGGSGHKVVMPAAARHAQIWHFLLPGNPPDKVKEVCAKFDAVCHEVGRDPAEIEKASSLNPGALLLSPAPKVRDEILMLQAAGVRHVILMPPITVDTMRQFAEQFFPEFHRA